MNPYASVDKVIRSWTKAKAIKKLFTKWADDPCRFFYISNASGICYQISIEPPHDGIVVLNLWSIEVFDGPDVHVQWREPVAGLERALDTALQTARGFMERKHG